MNSKHKNSAEKANKKPQWKRDDAVCKVIDFEQAQAEQSQRQWAVENKVPRTTLQYWLIRKESINASHVLIAFFESQEGYALLHKILMAAHVSFTKHGVASIHNVSEFLELSGLSAFIASSYSTQCRVSSQIDNEIIVFEKLERERLAKQMPKKKISLCEDETFHPQICLVAIEPVSNYIVVEKYADNREGATWDSAVSEGLSHLPVEVIQVSSDEGRGLLKHAAKGLQVHHSPDCFHVPYEIGKGTSGALASKVKQAEKEYEVAAKKTQTEVVSKEKYEALPKRPVGCPPNFEKKIASASEQEQLANSNLDQAKQNQKIVKEAKAEIGKVYHPFNLETGAIQDSQKVSGLLASCFEKINQATQCLSERPKKRVDKAHRVVVSMVATVTFFFTMINLHMDNMKLSEQERSLMNDYLIPGFYLQYVARKEKDIGQKGAISAKSRELLAGLKNRSGPFAEHSEDCLNRLKKAAKECTHIFQRSSSCVEGRNAQLSLRHHGIHRLSNRCLKAQTVVHNYYVKRQDGTTPAERFFEAKHGDLFECILDRMDRPARPRKRLRAVA